MIVVGIRLMDLWDDGVSRDFFTDMFKLDESNGSEMLLMSNATNTHSDIWHYLSKVMRSIDTLSGVYATGDRRMHLRDCALWRLAADEERYLMNPTDQRYC